MEERNVKTSISMSFETISLPPFRDILILTRKNTHGLYGMTKCMHILAPDGFEVYPIEDDDVVEAVLVSKRLLKRLSIGQILDHLREYVFPEMSEGEIMKVDMRVQKTVQITGKE